MSHQIPINVAFEDELSEEVLRKLLLNSIRSYLIGRRFPGRGYGYLKKKIRGFNNAARVMPCLVLTDLDDDECAPTKIRNWLPIPKHPNLLFRVAVKEVEAWLLADQVGFAKFLGIGRDLVPVNVDEVEDPKRSLIDLAKRSRKRKLREDLVPRRGSTAKQGPAYNDRLISFVRDYWDISVAKQSSSSLERTIRALEEFMPVWER